MKTKDIPTSDFYGQLYEAFDFYNGKLFSGDLDSPVISIRAKANSCGYFSPSRLVSVKKKNSVHEIAFNPIIFNRSLNEVLSTLVHEMAHQWQEQHGKPSRNNYHNKQWAHKMVDIGLIPSNTGEPGGKMTGSSMLDYIEDKGIFFKATKTLTRTHKFKFYYEILGEKKAIANSKIKYTCPLCSINVWGKPDLAITCTACACAFESE